MVLLEEIGYKSHEALHWFDTTAPEFEIGLNEMVGDQGIRDLIDWLRTNEEPEFHIYVEHSISKPIPAEEDEGVNCETIILEDSDNDAEGDIEVDVNQSSRKRKVSSPNKNGASMNNDDDVEGRGKGKAEESNGKGKSPIKIIHQKKKSPRKKPKYGRGLGIRIGDGPAKNHGGGPGVETVGEGSGRNVKYYQQELVAGLREALKEVTDPAIEVPQPPPQPTTRNANIPFKPPAQVANGAGSLRQFRAKQPIRRKSRKSPPPSEPATLSQETIAAASASTQKKFRFMQTPGMNNKHQ
ncbi:hypothetical protein PIB30_016378 [Stylosanthes scabra]|uniref:Uncharacterized protein n=1 Tax=Stylosanthes scabra TaxID=79078 RepID=A0ABU6T721_9FABA|nr:hypothetical protein [Stylosanthes scabra]